MIIFIPNDKKKALKKLLNLTNDIELEALVQKWIDDQINYTIDLKYKKSLKDKILELNQ